MKTISIASGWTYAVRKKRGTPEFELRRIETRSSASRLDTLEDGTPWEFVTRTRSWQSVRVLAVGPDGHTKGTFEFDGVELVQEHGTLVVRAHYTDARPPLFGPDGSMS
jgi:hypothetical protein